MQTESRPFFDAETARVASLTATLRRVRIRRRARKSIRAAAAIALIAVPLCLLRPLSPGPGNTVTQDPLIIRSRPLTAAQTVRSIRKPGIFIRSSKESGLTVRITTPPAAVVPRLGDAEFHQLLAVQEVGYIKLAGVPARVLPLRGIPPED